MLVVVTPVTNRAAGPVRRRPSLAGPPRQPLGRRVHGPRTLDDRLVDLGDRPEDVDRREPLAGDASVAKGSGEPVEVPVDDP